jgi:predicted TIM-barrel fold metal-dependent hydrolase
MNKTAINYKFISGDGHVTEPVDLWLERMDRRFRDRAPRVVAGTELPGLKAFANVPMSADAENSDFFVIDGLVPVDFIDTIATMANEKATGTPIMGRNHNRAAEARTGATDPRARLEDQDRDNLRAEVVYPNYAMYMFGAPDLEYRRECFRVYNDWLADYCAVAPGRLLGVAPLPLGGPIQWAVEEAQRAAKLGLKSVLLPADTPDRPWADPYYTPLWEALSDLAMPVGFHNSATEQFLRQSSLDNPDRQTIKGLATQLGSYNIVDIKIGGQMRSLTGLIGSAVPARYPRLRFVIAEGGIGWVPSVIRLMDHWWEDHHHWLEPRLEEPPSFYHRRQFWNTFEDDRAGLLTRELLNVDHLMWGSDYPHTEGTFPNSLDRVTQDFAGIPADVTRKLLVENAASLYGIGNR